jgi:hypothetical protein
MRPQALPLPSRDKGIAKMPGYNMAGTCHFPQYPYLSPAVIAALQN